MFLADIKTRRKLKIIGPIAVGFLGLAVLLVTHKLKFGMVQATTSQEPYSVIVVAGQSNAQGNGAQVSQLVPALGSHPADAATLMMYSVGDDQITQSWTNSSSSSFVPMTTLQPHAYFGPEVALARTLWDQGRRNMVILKVTYGGQRLESVSSPGSGAVSDWNTLSSGESYDKLKSRYQDLRSTMVANGDVFTVDGFYWMQGESDAMKGDSVANYQSSLTSLISSARTDLGMSPSAQIALGKQSIKYCTDNNYNIITNPSGCPITVCLIPQQSCSSLSAAVSGNSNVRTALQNVADLDPQVSIVETEDLPRTSSDWVHITSAGQVTLGQRMANITKDLLPLRVEGSTDYDGDGVSNLAEDLNGNGNLGDDDSDGDLVPNYLDSVNGAGGAIDPDLASISKTVKDNLTGLSTSTTRNGLLDWVVSYSNDSVGMINATITDSIAGDHDYVSGSLLVPGGYSKEFSTNSGASYSTTDSGSSTTDIKSYNDFISSPATGDTAALPQPFAGVFASSGGDTFAPIVYKGKAISLFHHSNSPSSENAIDCKDIATTSTCVVSGVTFPTYISSQVGPLGTGLHDLNTTTMYREFIDDGTYGNPDHMYFPATHPDTVSTANSTGGVACVNVVTFANCGYTVLGTGNQFRQYGSGVTSAMIEGFERQGSRLYSIGSDAKIYCFDMATDAACAGQPFTTSLPAWTLTGHDQAMGVPHVSIGSKMYLTMNYSYRCNSSGACGTNWTNQSKIYCFDMILNTDCSGWTNQTVTVATTGFFANLYGAIAGMFEWKDSSGLSQGICAIGQDQFLTAITRCYDPSTGALLATTPSNLRANIAGGGVSAFTQTTTVGNKLYVGFMTTAPSGTNTFIVCYDFSIQNQCAGFGNYPAGVSATKVATFPSVNGGRSSIYTVREYDGCMWAAGDSGVAGTPGSVWSFDPDTGSQPCSKTKVSGQSVTPSTFYCDGSTDHVSAWKDIRLIRGNVSDYTGLRVTVKDSSGNPIPGFTDLDALIIGGVVTSLGVVDLSSLSYASYPSLSYEVSASISGSASPWVPASNTPYFQMTFDGDDPQICYQTRVSDMCDIQAPIQNDAKVTATSSTGQSSTVSASTSIPVAYGYGELCIPDITVSKDDSKTLVYPNNTLSYVVTISNTSSSDPNGTAVDVVLTDNLPPDTTFVSASDGGTESGGVVTWPAVTIPGSSFISRIVVVSVKSSASPVNNLVNTASADLEGDPTPGNNSDTDTDSVGVPASIGDQVWKDTDRDGVFDPTEVGFQGVTVELLFDGVVISSKVTDSSGLYLFTNLEPDSGYQIRVVSPSGYQISPKDAGGDDSKDSDVDTVSGLSVYTDLEAAENDLSWDAGLNLIPASIGNVVWEDVDKDGQKDSSEPGIPGVTVELLLNGTVIATKVTDSNGQFIFTDLDPVSGYQLRFSRPTGYDPTSQDSGGDNGIDSDIDPETYTTISIDLSAGQSDLTWYAGFVKSSTTVVVPPESNNSGGGIKEAPILGGLSNTGINILLGLLSLAVITGAIFTARKRSNSNRQYRLH